MTDRDADYMLRLLMERPHTTGEMIDRSFRERGCRFTPHSRAADLRRRGITVECARVGTINRRAIYMYSLPEPVQLELAS